MPGQSEGRIGLSDFLADLRTELSEAQSRAEGDELKLAVEEVNLSLDVTYTLTGDTEVAGKVRAKFWVFAAAEASAKAGLSTERARTQRLTLTLKPRLERVVVDEEGQQTTITRGVDVVGTLTETEQRPDLPTPEPSEAAE